MLRLVCEQNLLTLLTNIVNSFNKFMLKLNKIIDISVFKNLLAK